MSHLTPADIRNAVFKKPPLGKRGYDEEEVDTFLDRVEQTIAALTDEVNSLRAGAGLRTPAATPAGGAASSVSAELEQIKHRLARLEAMASVSAPRQSPSSAGWQSPADPLYGAGA